ncbi:MAG: bifunctional 2-C-methyl-D-erythritol 4-phosphate cytidylyltransferase/2-C-methyl-D-erythritol 2,4-cyclodiphosphate synthase [Alphaproteobacteria bacterium]
MTDSIALIVAAGRGKRMAGHVDDPAKQYMRLGTMTVLAHSIAAFQSHPRITAVRVVIHADDRDLYDKAIFDLVSGEKSLLEPVIGGATRQDSVRLGLESISGSGFGTVLIHDGARPLVDSPPIDRVLDALKTAHGAIPAMAINDSLKQAPNGVITGAHVDREGLYRAQTPQGFAFDKILSAHQTAASVSSTFTDDAGVGAAAGIEVCVVAGTDDNFKITTAEDLARAEHLLAGMRETRHGSGFDVHAFDPDQSGPVRLCGIDVPFDKSLSGHSDADVGLHALTDALLGAIGAEDIGAHFPPSDPRWKDADSSIFLKRASEIVISRGGTIINADITIICEAPKIAPWGAKMSEKVAEIIGIPPERISIKATTTERLGTVGEGQGIAAQAIATIAIQKPKSQP